ncbi:hypothetical protein [Hoeflea poritis]|uniref:Tripartite tricarboxylate transporter TctB n=1 Tax=Hoeflea poritis TaxID=2993659 RepID=A0ABT4VUW1_9HYPH|nr:hypothetical protein [Hoeflea poritis]MDA4848507.1 hypothetical protein [Hoeflea poritis]
MPNSSRVNVILGWAIVVFSLLLVFVWIPLDTTTGVIERVRRQTLIGDSMAPMIAGIFLLIGGALLLVFERKASDQPQIDPLNLGIVTLMAAVIAAGFLIMRFAGPAAVEINNLITGSDLEYRLLRDTPPWKYIGYFLGGVLSITGVISLAEGRFSIRAALSAVCAVIFMIAIYDFPFDDLLLPPNGDF